MSRRRLLEILVALVVVLLLLTVILVRRIDWRTGFAPRPDEPRALFRPVPGAPPDFAAGGFRVLAARAPDGSRSAVLYPVEFEMPAELWVVTGPGAGTRYELADSLRATTTAKNVGWLDDRQLWVVLGYLYGTVSPGGDLWAVDPASGTARPLWASPDTGRTQAVAAEPEGAGRAITVRLKAFDANMMNPRDSVVSVPR